MEPSTGNAGPRRDRRPRRRRGRRSRNRAGSPEHHLGVPVEGREHLRRQHRRVLGRRAEGPHLGGETTAARLAARWSASSGTRTARSHGSRGSPGTAHCQARAEGAGARRWVPAAARAARPSASWSGWASCAHGARIRSAPRAASVTAAVSSSSTPASPESGSPRRTVPFGWTPSAASAAPVSSTGGGARDSGRRPEQAHAFLRKKAVFAALSLVSLYQEKTG